MIELSELRRFIFVAKQNTYAISKDGDEKINDDCSREFQYCNSKFFYRDKYFGIDPFSGQEVVYYNKSPVWCMNYYGTTIKGEILKNEIYTFLRVALSHLNENHPYRGSDNLIIGKFRYNNIYNGDLLHFSGHEEIYYEEQLVYSLDYFGGQVIE